MQVQQVSEVPEVLVQRLQQREQLLLRGAQT